MTARSLHSFPVRNALRVVKQNQKMTIVTCILYLLGIPMIVAATMMEMIVDSRNMQFYFSSTLYILLGGFCLSVAVFMGMIAAINSFTELHSKTKVDMLYSLPLTGRQRFFSDFIGGCCMYILPYVISVILGWIIILVMFPFIRQGDSDTPQRVAEIITLGEISKYYALLTFGLLALMLLYFALSAFVTVCCGTLFECIYTNLLLNILIPGTVAAVLGVISANVDLDFAYLWQMIGYMSPIGGLIYLIYLISDPYSLLYSYSYYSTFTATQTSGHEMLPAYLRWIFAIVIISVLLTAAAWQLYVRRKAEHVSKPFVYLAAYYVMLTLITVLILCIMSFGLFVAGPALLFAAIVYFVMEVIRKRGFRKFWLSAITYIVTVGVTVGMFAMVVFTDCFGRVNYVPPSAMISSVAIQMPAYMGSYSRLRLEYTDRDVISAVAGLHRDFVSLRKSETYNQAINQALTDKHMLELNYDNYKYDTYNDYMEYYLAPPYYAIDTDWYDYSYSYYERTVSNYLSRIKEGVLGEYCSYAEVEINYYTITGSIIHRSYDLNPDEFQELLSAVQGTSLYAEALSDGFRSGIESALTVYNTSTGQSITQAGSITVSNVGGRMKNINGYSDYTSLTLSIHNGSVGMEALCSAYRRDLEAMTPEQFRTSALNCAIYNLPVYDACTETLAVLKEYGYEGFSVAQRYNVPVIDVTADNYYGDKTDTLAVRIYAPGTYSADSLEYPCSTISSFYFLNDADGTPVYEDFCSAWSLAESYPELYALMDAAQGHYITSEGCYALVVNGTTYIVPPESADLAQAVIDKGNWFAQNNLGYGYGTTGGFYDDWYDDDWYNDNWYDDDWYDDDWYDDDWYDDGGTYYGGGGGGFDDDWFEENGWIYDEDEDMWYFPEPEDENPEDYESSGGGGGAFVPAEGGII